MTLVERYQNNYYYCEKKMGMMDDAWKEAIASVGKKTLDKKQQGDYVICSVCKGEGVVLVNDKEDSKDSSVYRDKL